MFDRDAIIEFNRKKLEEQLHKKERGIKEASKGSFTGWGMMALGRFKAKRLGGRPGLYKRTGDLARSFRFWTKGNSLNDLEGHFSSRSKYAHIHEKGGKIVPKKAKMLAIPIPGGPALTPAGVARYSSPLRSTLPSDQRFFVKRTNAGNLILFGQAAGKEALPWYVLKHSVKIPPRMKLQTTINQEVRKNLLSDMRKDIKRAIDRG